MHFDLISTDFDAEIDRLTSPGATKLNEVKKDSPTGSPWPTPTATNSTSSTGSDRFAYRGSVRPL